ncbi:hypothetical protein [Absidia glauca]|uniref:Uncharacterized protein n=1 Tax=Absidia glauca TaxID=4829 RepID=A0A163JS69_ABSGL|nr:hypothetical protein [Absidia glauca]
MLKYTLVFFFLALLSVTFAQIGDSNSDWDEEPGFGDDDLRGKPCRSVEECGIGWLYCIDKICQEKQPGRDCVAEGSFYTGGKSCCPPMVNPRQVNTPCRMLSTTSCKSDRDCSIRNGWQYSKCCPDKDKGNGLCIGRTEKC